MSTINYPDIIGRRRRRHRRRRIPYEIEPEARDFHERINWTTKLAAGMMVVVGWREGEWEKSERVVGTKCC